MRALCLLFGPFLFSFGLEAQTYPARVKVILNDKGLSNTEVEFLKFSADAEPLGVTKAKTNSQGLAQAFLSAEDKSFAARVVYQGVSYFSDLLSARSGDIVNLVVYPSSKESDKIRISDLRIFAYPTEEGLYLHQEFVVLNEGSSTYVGRGDGEAAETFRFSLPNSAFELERGMGITDESTRIENNDVIINTPLVPGQTRFSLSYKMEKKRGSTQFMQKFSVPLDEFSLGLASPSIKPHFDFEVSVLPKFFNNQITSTYRATFSDQPVKELGFKFSGLPLNIRFSQWMPFIVLVALLMMVIFNQRRGASEVLTDAERLSLIAELRKLEALKSQKLIEDSEYQLRRLLVLEKLWPNDEVART